jgi:peroxiredoxin Q/BCP
MKKPSLAMLLTGIIAAFSLTFAEDSMLGIGTQAPNFSLLSNKGDTVTLSSFIGKNHVVLIFYPGDQTPGCTKQLCAIRDDYSQFAEKGAVVFGVNQASAESHEKFAKKQNYDFPLLVDAGKKTAKAYKADGLMIQRTVYVIDKEGKIAFAKRGTPDNLEILEAIN